MFAESAVQSGDQGGDHARGGIVHREDSCYYSTLPLLDPENVLAACFLSGVRRAARASVNYGDANRQTDATCIVCHEPAPMWRAMIPLRQHHCHSAERNGKRAKKMT